MDTYGHLFPGQEADTVARFPNLLSNPLPRVMQATGTYDQMPQPEPEGAAHVQAQRAGTGETRQTTAKHGDPAQRADEQEDDDNTRSNLLPVSTLGERRQEAAKAGNSGRGGT